MLSDCFLQLSKSGPVTQQSHCKCEKPHQSRQVLLSLQLFEATDAQIKHDVHGAGSRGRPDATADL